jgi:GxxExxY protein
MAARAWLSSPEQKTVEPQRTRRDTEENNIEVQESGEMIDNDELTGAIIGAAIEVHRELGPGLLESAYEECLAHEFGLRGLAFERQKPIPVIYKGVQVDCGFRVDLLLKESVIIELKAIEGFAPIHEAQILTYLKLTGCM